MQPGNVQDSPDDLRKDVCEEMEKFGITRVRVDNFYYGGFHYTNLDDALAEARRHPPAS